MKFYFLFQEKIHAGWLKTHFSLRMKAKQKPLPANQAKSTSTAQIINMNRDCVISVQ